MKKRNLQTCVTVICPVRFLRADHTSEGRCTGSNTPNRSEGGTTHEILVTGGAGFIGNHIAEALLAGGHSVRIIDNLHAGSLERISHIMDRIEFIKADIRDKCALRPAMRECDGVFHQAALVSVQESYAMKQEYHDVNVTGAKNFLEHVAELGIKIVYASSPSVYGNPQSTPISEDAPRSPENPYGATKADAEVVAQEYTRNGASVVGLRYFNVYGNGQTGTYAGVITQFMRRPKAKPPVINGDGVQSRDLSMWATWQLQTCLQCPAIQTAVFST